MPPPSCAKACKIYQRMGTCRGCGRVLAQARRWTAAREAEKEIVVEGGDQDPGSVDDSEPLR